MLTGELSKAAYQSQNFRSGQQGILRGQICAFLRHTVHTSQVTLLSQGYP